MKLLSILILLSAVSTVTPYLFIVMRNITSSANFTTNDAAEDFFDEFFATIDGLQQICFKTFCNMMEKKAPEDGLFRVLHTVLDFFLSCSY
ncbi:unnamed protein product [Caenorhabditis brenneri]